MSLAYFQHVYGIVYERDRVSGEVNSNVHRQFCFSHYWFDASTIFCKCRWIPVIN